MKMPAYRLFTMRNGRMGSSARTVITMTDISSLSGEALNAHRVADSHRSSLVLFSKEHI
jgi:hypothetical protein